MLYVIVRTTETETSIAMEPTDNIFNAWDMFKALTEIPRADEQMLARDLVNRQEVEWTIDNFDDTPNGICRYSLHVCR